MLKNNKNKNINIKINSGNQIINVNAINVNRIGLFLNFSVFCYEVKGEKKEGCKIAKKAFEDSMKYLDELEKFKSKDILLLIQLNFH